MSWLRHLRPRFDAGSWDAGALPDYGDRHVDEAEGFCLVVQWLGVLVEIGVGRVRRL